MKIINAVIKPIDWAMDCLELFRSGYEYANGEWTFGKRVFASRDFAMQHLRDSLALTASVNALKKFSKISAKNSVHSS